MHNPSQDSESVVTAPKVVLRLTNISKQYIERGQPALPIVRELDIDIYEGELLAIVGASGSGKSTLLHIMGLLDSPDSGQVYLQGEAVPFRNANRCAQLRNQHIGFVYQFHHLLPEFTAIDNVAMPLHIRGVGAAKADQQAQAMLEQVGLGQRLWHKPAELSGGERQRVALARALVTQPALVLADEPTGNLDRESAKQVFALLKQINQHLGTAFVIVTHDPLLAAQADRCLRLVDGQLHDGRG